METTAVSKTTSKGQALEIRVSDGAILAYLDGNLLGKVYSICVRGKPVQVGATTITHYLDTKPAAVGLTTAEAKQLETARRASYEPKPPSLAEQRRDLVGTVNSLLDSQRNAYEQAHDQQGNAWAVNAEYDARIEAAKSALATFDAEHPEIAADIKARRKAEQREIAERHAWD